MFITALALLFSANASAAVPTALPQPPVHQVVYADDTANIDDFSGSIYVQARGSAAMPANTSGIATPSSIGLGARWEDGTRLGMRAMVMPNPPDVFYASPGPVGGGLVLDYAHHFPVSRKTSFYPVMSAGVLLTVDEYSNDNVVLPVTEAGVGLEYAASLRSGNHMTISPEIGLVPFLLAPYAALNVGVLFDAQKN